MRTQRTTRTVTAAGLLATALLTAGPSGAAAASAATTKTGSAATTKAGPAATTKTAQTPATTKAPKAPSAASALNTLVRQTSAIPASSVGKKKRAALVSSARKAQRTRSTNACRSVAELGVYRRALAKTTVSPALKGKAKSSAGKKLALLGPSSISATTALLRSPKTKSCGGGKSASTVTTATPTILSQDADGMKLRVQLPELQFVPESAGGKQWTRLAVGDTESPGTPGTPGIPTSTESFGIPEGATVSVEAKATSSYTLDGVNVYPVQDDVVDQAQGGNTPMPDFTKGEFVNTFDVSTAAYRQKGLVPAAPADGVVLGQSRDVTVGSLRLPSAQYDAAKGELKVLQSVDVDVKFNGGDHRFAGALDSPWEATQNRFAGGLVNASTIERFRGPKIIFQPCGEEMLVITNPSTRSVADTFATARRAAGLRVRVMNTGGGASDAGTTATAIQTTVRAHLNSPGCIRPTYVTIIGDDELVPTFTTGPSGIPSDNPYSTKNDTDELPDVAVGRILGNDLTELGNAIAKIIGYETTPPTGTFLNRATVAAQFQDTDEAGEVNDGREDRTFIQFAETVRNGLVARGNTVDRIYADSPTTTPLKFNDGTSLPASIKKPGFAWDGDAADVTAAWNQGRFLMVHRDHGWSDGWGEPHFETSNLSGLTNGANLPVVMSINCASAQYDTDETSFVQTALVKAAGGAVGVFGDTRNSPSWHNSQLGLGMVDALLPSVLPGEGPAGKQRVGQALINGKLRLASLAPPSGPGISGGDGNTRKELYLWHYFGDPSMKMWGGGIAPIVFDPVVFKAVYEALPVPLPGDPPPFEVNVQFPAGLAVAGQPVSLLRNGEVIGKAIAGDGSVKVGALFTEGDAPLPGELEIAIDAEDAVPVKFPVTNVPPKATPTPIASPSPEPTPVPSITPTPTPAPTPAPLPDLVVSGMTSSTVTVKNQGKGPSAPFKVKVTNTTQETLLVDFAGLEAGASATGQYSCASIGGRGFHADADPTGAVAETDETNNAFVPQQLLACPNG
ncbi:MAG: C25 family cysteine peptidase [Solirubrobacteraceae bacterium]|nr:C25 family cysteine peptidase [Solirubrobacteraceae bacterium]